MIKSKLILDIFSLLLEGEDENFTKQIPFLSEKNYDYTGMGVFINFDSQSEIFEYASKIEIETSFLFVEIKNEKLDIEAEAILWVKNGIIHELEIYNFNGVDFPNINNLEHYELSQNWIGSNDRKIIR